MDAQEYGKRVKAVRQSLGMQQQELAKLCGLSPAHLSLIETGKRLPSMPNAYKIAKVLGAGFAETSNTVNAGLHRLFDALTKDDKRFVMELLIRLQSE